MNTKWSALSKVVILLMFLTVACQLDFSPRYSGVAVVSHKSWSITVKEVKDVKLPCKRSKKTTPRSRCSTDKVVRVWKSNGTCDANKCTKPYKPDYRASSSQNRIVVTEVYSVFWTGDGYSGKQIVSYDRYMSSKVENRAIIEENVFHGVIVKHWLD